MLKKTVIVLACLVAGILLGRWSKPSEVIDVQPFLLMQEQVVIPLPSSSYGMTRSEYEQIRTGQCAGCHTRLGLQPPETLLQTQDDQLGFQFEVFELDSNTRPQYIPIGTF